MLLPVFFPFVLSSPFNETVHTYKTMALTWTQKTFFPFLKLLLFPPLSLLYFLENQTLKILKRRRNKRYVTGNQTCKKKKKREREITPQADILTKWPSVLHTKVIFSLQGKALFEKATLPVALREC